MAFPSVPEISKNQINKAGKVLVKRNTNPQGIEAARDVVNQWRACHAYPINTFQSTLRDKVAQFSGEQIVAQRLKRMPTIIDKLKRYPAMQLTTMQDIGGVRTVLNSIEDVYKLRSSYREEGHFPHQFYKEDDYIQNPRDADGYRSLHLIYRYKNVRAPQYDGLFVEIQIRTRLQHIWATAVETMGTFLGQALKSRQGDTEWLDFFAIISSAFAHEEKTNEVPRFKNMPFAKLCVDIGKREKRLRAIEKMQLIASAVQVLGGDKNAYYYLLTLDSTSKSVRIKLFRRDQLEQATQAYEDEEDRVTQGEKVESVLVSAGSINTLKRAYPNFFLDTKDFMHKLEEIILV